MDRLAQVLHAFKSLAIYHPYLTGTAAVFGIAVLILRRIHQRFVVYPGTNNNMQMLEAGATAKTSEATVTPKSKA